MTELVVALVAASAVFLAAWWGQPGRKAVGIHRYVQLLNELPEDSKQRDRLVAEIDKMIDIELDNRLFNEVAQMVWTIFAFGVVGSLATSIARSHGGTWWAASIGFWVMTFAMAGAFVVGLWYRWKARTRKPLEPGKKD
ncbi:hypothetical protein LGT39_09480 [Demequina sp. TTPB684]|uniref:hypothetical protein n=1 Tax=unclassified Demequina TaxID=2620311 RepID=UPI001CF4E49C|nr:MULTISPECIES: hypothetical protein [unclassified Demequina]MCB2413071.1 hypothetical protein [Demequina sp. TTPB684]UPU88121.1 hypothetical protein LGT36_012860 [Demequina sp. TMPB413]